MVQSFCIEYMHIDTYMYVIKHHNKFQRNGQRRLSKHFLLKQIGSGLGRRRMSDCISSMGLKSRRAKNHSKELREKQFPEIVRTKHTVFDLITAPALITATSPPLTFYFIFTYYRTLDDLFLDFLLYFHLSLPT